MPDWVVKILLPYVIPIVVQAITPVIAEYVKKLADYLGATLPRAAMLAVASGIAEAVNQAQAALSGASLPPGAGAIIAVFLNELAKDLGKQPPTPGLK